MNPNNKFNQRRTQITTSYEPMSKPNESKAIILTDQNYYGWSKQMENTLMGQKLLKHIQYTDPRDYYFENRGDEENLRLSQTCPKRAIGQQQQFLTAPSQGKRSWVYRIFS